MADDFLSSLIGDPRLARALRIFIFNPDDVFSARILAKRAGVSRQAAVQAIKSLESIDIIRHGRSVPAPERAWKRTPERRRKGKSKREPAWMLNQKFRFLRALSMFVHEISPVHYRSILTALQKAGRVSVVILSGEFMGDASRPADLIVVADSMHEGRLDQAVRKMEPTFGREIRYAYFTTPEFRYRLTIQDRLVRDTIDYPHITLLDKYRLL